MLASKDFPILSCDKAADFMECVWQLTAYTYSSGIFGYVTQMTNQNAKFFLVIFGIGAKVCTWS